MIRYVAMAIGAALLIWLGYLFIKAVPSARAGEPGAKLNLFGNVAGMIAVVGFLVFIVTAFQQ